MNPPIDRNSQRADIDVDATGDSLRMVLMRGLPSCGKTHAARRLATPDGVHLEFDEYFHTQVGRHPAQFDWSATLLPDARRWFFDRVKTEVDRRTSPIIVDNDNTASASTQEYVTYAGDRGYRVEFREPESCWWRSIRELLRDKDGNAAELRAWARKLAVLSRATHRVPIDEFHRRIRTWNMGTLRGVTTAG